MPLCRLVGMPAFVREPVMTAVPAAVEAAVPV